MAKAAPKQQTDWNAIASFYAGRPVTVDFPETKWGADWGSGGWGGSARGNQVILGPFQKSMLSQFLSRGPRGPAGPGSVAGLATLIHEAIHLRDFDPRSGFKHNSDENQAGALGSELIPDLLQRFFGIPIGSPLSRKYEAAAKRLGNYQTAYGR